MKLKKAVQIGYENGLVSVDSSIEYVKNYCYLIIPREDVGWELAELDSEYKMYKKGEIQLDLNVILKQALRKRKDKGHFE